MKARMRTFLLFMISITWSVNSLAQSRADSLFNAAQYLAEEANYSQAILIVKDLTVNYPENQDYSDYLSRLYYWSQDFEQAKANLLYNRSPEKLSYDQLELLIRCETALKETESAIAAANIGIKQFPDAQEHFRLLTGIALYEANRYDEAVSVLSLIPKKDSEGAAADYILNQIFRAQKNTINAGYLLTTFDNPNFSNQQAAFVEYGRKFNHYSQVLRVNYANLYQKQAVQVETDAYIKIKQHNYLFVNLGVSEKNAILPRYRAGTEFFTEHKHFSASLGARYLYFTSQNAPVMLTGHAALIQRDWSFYYRPFVVFLTNKTLASHLFYIRKSFPRRESYVQLDLQYGSLPYFYYSSEVLSRLNAYRIGVNTRIRVKNNWFIQPIFMFEREEYVPDQYRNRYTFQLITSFRF